MRLDELLEGDYAEVTQATGIGTTEIAGLTSDSRRVEPGFLFAALPGSQADGRDFIAEAVARGATCVLAPPGTRIEPTTPPVPLLTDDNPRRRFAFMAARFFGRQPAIVAAVTGTNGKTSVVSFARQIWIRLGFRAASLGTLGITAPDRHLAANLTTPDPVELHRRLAELTATGVQCLALEASSHGLDQYRLDGIQVTAAAFTNLSRDHLDYHGTMRAYLDSKTRLFTEVMKPGGSAVLNADAEPFPALARTAEVRRQRVIGYGRNGEHVRLIGAEAEAGGQRLELSVMGRRYRTMLPLVGGFQADNALCALALVVACGGDVGESVAALETLEGVPGRVQLAGRRANGASVYVDYAHTPDALASILGALRPHARGRLVVVFGCGGERDPGKRPEMGRIAGELADRVVVTDDNPRHEDAAAIRRQIMAACPGGRDIGDRGEAIVYAVGRLGPDDLLVIAGKGHESGQTVGDEVRPFDDVEVVAEALGESAK